MANLITGYGIDRIIADAAIYGATALVSYKLAYWISYHIALRVLASRQRRN
jgi:hypothetical protein